MGIKRGLDLRLNRNSATYVSPTWANVGNVGNVNHGKTKRESDVTTRGRSGHGAVLGTIKDTVIEATMPYDPADVDLLAFQASWDNDTVIEIALSTADIATTGTLYRRYDVVVLDVSEDQPIDGAAMVKVVMKLAPSTHTPSTITAS